MNEQDREKAFLEKVKAALDASEESLDASILAGLQRARNRALAAREKRHLHWLHWLRFPAAGFATAAVAILVAGIYFSRPSGIETYRHFEDVEILASRDNLDFYADLDFYLWFAGEQGQAG